MMWYNHVLQIILFLKEKFLWEKKALLGQQGEGEGKKKGDVWFKTV